MTTKTTNGKAPKPPPDKADSAKGFDPRNVSGAVLAELLGLNRRQVTNLYQQRTIKQNGKRGKYDLFECVPLYVQSIKTSGTAEAGERLKIAQRRKIEQQNDTVAGLLVPLGDVAGTLNESAAGFLSAWRAIPRRIAGKLAVLRDAKRCRELLEHEAAKARLELFAPIRKFYADRGEALPDILADTFDVGKAPAAKPRKVGRRKPRVAKRKRRTRAVAQR